MLSSWRRKKRSAANNKKQVLEELMIPSNFQCPISLDLMKDPVTLSTGITYDRENIERWIEKGNRTCPKTNQVLGKDLLELEPIPNHTLRKMIQEWCVENKSYGIERIPTPRIPISSYEVKKILAGVEVAAGIQKDGKKCKELVAAIKAEAKQSERNKRCFLANGITGVLSSTFVAFSDSKSLAASNVDVLEEILSALATFSHRGPERNSVLGSMDSLPSLVWFLRSGNLSARRNAVLVLVKVVTSDNHDHPNKVVDDLVQIEGVLEALVTLIKEPICPNTTKATLLLMYHLVSRTSSSSTNDEKNIKTRLVNMGVVELLLEILVDTDKSMSEKALGILNEICSSSSTSSSNSSCSEGKRRMYRHALAVPVLVKKILRVSDLVNEFSVSILWEMIIGCEKKGGEGGGEEEGGSVLVLHARQLGAFQKLLLLIQVGCDEKTKQKASDLLKVLNLYKNNRADQCVLQGGGSLEFKNLNRTFE